MSKINQPTCPLCKSNDNVAELTAQTNDEGWDTVYAPWLECSHLNKKDVVFVFSVDGYL